MVDGWRGTACAFDLANLLGDVMATMTIDVEVDLDLIDTDELKDALMLRGEYTIPDEIKEQIQIIYDLRQQGKPFDHELNQLIYAVLGRLSC